jgi:hypothetical protein
MRQERRMVTMLYVGVGSRILGNYGIATKYLRDIVIEYRLAFLHKCPGMIENNRLIKALLAAQKIENAFS